MSSVELTIDGKKIIAEEGEKVLWAAIAADIFIPHLCANKENKFHPGSCRLCYVEVEGIDQPVTSCNLEVKPDMVVKTRSDKIDRLVKTGFLLLMSTHRLECKKCAANKNCALQTIAKERKVPLASKRFVKIDPELPIDESRDDFGFNPNRCVLCGQCVYVCNKVNKCRVLDFAGRGLEMKVGTFDGGLLKDQDCNGCMDCVNVCPVGALYKKT